VVHWWLQPYTTTYLWLSWNQRDKRAVGVEFTNDPLSCPDADQSSSTVIASKLVVVSAGAFGSPTILERSGIGAKAVLKRCGIEQLVNLPGVGENYQGVFSLIYVVTLVYAFRSQSHLDSILCC
jgi:choline dehydrogenase-like flavoprotein